MKNQKGMVMVVVISTILFIVLVIQDTVFETQVEHRSARAELDALQAYYAAKSGAEIALLRIKAYRKMSSISHAQIGNFRSYIDMIWRFPFYWPIILEKNKKLDNKQNWMQAQYQTSLVPTSGRLDINDLASHIPSLRNWTFDVLLNLIMILRQEQEDLRNSIQEADVLRVLDNIKDWADTDTYKEDGISPEAALYSETNMPANRSFIHTAELLKVAGMTGILYKALQPFITVYGEKGININMASIQLLRALHSDFSEELAQQVTWQTHHAIPPVVFTKSSFSTFLKERGFEKLAQDLLTPSSVEDPKNTPAISYLNFNAPYNFIIKSRGISGKMQKEITAIYVDMAALSKQFNHLVKEENTRRKVTGQGSSSKTDKLHLQPSIIYWKESS